MSKITVMVSPFFNGGTFTDEKTGITFRQEDKLYEREISTKLDLSGIKRHIMLNHLILVDAPKGFKLEKQEIIEDPEKLIEELRAEIKELKEKLEKQEAKTEKQEKAVVADEEQVEEEPKKKTARKRAVKKEEE